LNALSRIIAIMLMRFFLFACLSAVINCYAQDTAYVQTGLASYYHHKFNGRKTTSGEIYSGKKLTAAHKTLPLGAKVKVTNLSTHKWVIVRINDRGPHSKKRIIDVSKRAAKHLGMLNGKGIVKVKVEWIERSSTPDIDFRRNEAQ
jgi:rare lipoprotein A